MAVETTGVENVPLGEVITLHYGKALPKVDRDSSGLVPVYGANGVKDRSNKSLTVGPSLIVGRKGSAGEVTRVEGSFWPLDVTYYTTHDETRIEFSYLEYALSTLDLPSLARGVKPGINRNDVYELEIPLPPLDEQKRIVAVLDQAFAALDRARENAEANLADVDATLTSKLNQLFQEELVSAPLKTFDHITDDTLIGLVRSKKEQRSDLSFDYIKMQHIGNDDRFLGGTNDRVECSPDEADRYQLSVGDFLFNTRNSRELVGKSCVIETAFSRRTVFNNNIMRVRFVPGVLPSYIALAFRSSDIKAQLEAMKSGTTSVVAIYHKSLKRLRLPMPCEETQRRITNTFQKIDANLARVSKNYSIQLTDIADLRQSLLQKAFSGQLT